MTEFDEERVLIECGFANGFVATASTDGEVETEDYEDAEGEDLEGETGYHDVVPGCGAFVGVCCCGGDAATCGLEEEGEEIAGDELVQHVN